MFRFWPVKLAKGLAAIFAIKITLISGAIPLESCQTQEDEYGISDKTEALDSFEAVVSMTTPKIRTIIEKYPGFTTGKSGTESDKFRYAVKRS